MDKNERRKYPRVDASNLIECCCLDENDNELGHRMVRAIDVSPVGAKIESFQKIESETVRLATTDTDGSLFEIKGRVVHRHETEDGRYELGICFTESEVENTRFALKLIGVCHKVEPSFIMVKRVLP